MTVVPLRLGPLKADGYAIQRSGVRWLRRSGDYCRAGEVFGYCNLSLEAASGKIRGPSPFAEEMELQVCFAARVSGRLTMNAAEAPGGYLSIHGIHSWRPDTIIGEIETDSAAEGNLDASRVRLMVVAGRRMTALADVHAGLLRGWHGRTRGWWCEEGEVPLTLLSMGVCDATGLVLGDECAFFEMFAGTPGAAQMVFTPDAPMAPAVPVLVDQLNRTPAQFEAICADLHAFLADSPTKPTPEDWMFAGALTSVMQRNPIKDNYPVFSAAGSAKLGPADAILLSLAVEPQAILRHRKQGFHVHVMRHHQAAAGPAMRAWLNQAFEPVKRSVDDIKRDYEALVDGVQRATGGRLVVLNRMSTSGYEDISSYMPFDAPLSATLSNVAAKEWNLMLHDIAAEREIHIVDVDAMAADIGGAEHLPDGIHQSGLMQAVLRQEIIGIMNGMRGAVQAPPTRSAAVSGG